MTDLVVWWNVQRLLAPTSTRLTRALDATEAQGWDAAAYHAKLRALGAVLHHVCDGRRPALLALAEVQSTPVLRDLLAAAGWPELEIAEDPVTELDGNDLMVAYDPDRLTPTAPAVSHTVTNRFATRDIFELELETARGEPLIVITNHWPSRVVSNSPALRIASGDYLRRLVERRLLYAKEELVDAAGRRRLPGAAALQERAELPLLVLGDFNDAPYDVSVADVLGSVRRASAVTGALRFPTSRGLAGVNGYLRRRARLFNPSWGVLAGTPGGTSYWSGDWYMLDQVLVSRGLLLGDAPRYVDDSLLVHAPRRVPALDGGAPVDFCSAAGVPRAFDSGTRKGVADHLPLTLELGL